MNKENLKIIVTTLQDCYDKAYSYKRTEQIGKKAADRKRAEVQLLSEMKTAVMFIRNNKDCYDLFFEMIEQTQTTLLVEMSVNYIDFEMEIRKLISYINQKINTID